MVLENVEFEEYNCIFGVYSYKSNKLYRMTPFKFEYCISYKEYH